MRLCRWDVGWGCQEGLVAGREACHWNMLRQNRWSPAAVSFSLITIFGGGLTGGICSTVVIWHNGMDPTIPEEFLPSADIPRELKKTRTPSGINQVPQLKIDQSVSFGRNHHNQTIATKSKWYGKFLSVFNVFCFSCWLSELLLLVLTWGTWLLWHLRDFAFF